MDAYIGLENTPAEYEQVFILLHTETYPVCDDPLSRSAKRSLPTSQKPRQNHRSYYVLSEVPSHYPIRF